MDRRAEAIRTVPHGIVFVYDPTMVIDIPPDTGAGPVLATANCVSVWTQHEVDGAVQLIVSASDEDHGCSLVYEGTIASNGRRLAIHTSNCEAVVETDVEGVVTALRIYTNDPQSPTKVTCVVGPRHSCDARP
ncbi:MAG: hypothetical protein EON58_13950 [Alphaproteobacteria bacterium]|nr:MAG: hypothetical protein EON58_13950 [Alphaproteobacteria bacterium]